MKHLLHKLANALPISHYFLARYAEEASADPEQAMGELVQSVYAEVYQKLLEEDQLIEICERLAAHGQKVADTPATPDTGKKKAAPAKAFSDYLNAWLAKLDMSEVCLWIADFNPVEARRLYLVEDYEVVEAMAELKQGWEREKARLHFEGALFGFGGKYGTSSGKSRDEGEVRVHDMSQMSSAEALARMAAMGKRH